MIGGDIPFYVKIWQILTHPVVKDRFLPRCRMQTRSSDENSVRPSVRLSVKRVNCGNTEEKSVQIFIPIGKKI